MGKVKELLLEDLMPEMTSQEVIVSELNDDLELTVDVNMSNTSVIISIFDSSLKEGQTMFISKAAALELAQKLEEYANA